MNDKGEAILHPLLPGNTTCQNKIVFQKTKIINVFKKNVVCVLVCLKKIN